MALRTHNLPFGHLKKIFAEVDEAKFQGVDGSSARILCIPGIE
jgi:hypothetical protein